MNRIFRYLLCIALLAMAFEASARDVYSLNRGWTFSTGRNHQGVAVNLPHTWNNDAMTGKSDYFRGEGYYDRMVTVLAPRIRTKSL